jgi:hypothetical protein
MVPKSVVNVTYNAVAKESWTATAIPANRASRTIVTNGHGAAWLIQARQEADCNTFGEG